jgi:hypothetical protein
MKSFAERLRDHETNPATWYPVPGVYLASVRRADAIVAQGGTIKTDWAGSALDARQWAAEKRRALHARITTKGGRAYTRYDSPHERGLHVGFVRDQMRLRDIGRRIIVRQFETRTVRERFSHLLYQDEAF